MLAKYKGYMMTSYNLHWGIKVSIIKYQLHDLHFFLALHTPTLQSCKLSKNTVQMYAGKGGNKQSPCLEVKIQLYVMGLFAAIVCSILMHPRTAIL